MANGGNAAAQAGLGHGISRGTARFSDAIFDMLGIRHAKQRERIADERYQSEQARQRTMDAETRAHREHQRTIAERRENRFDREMRQKEEQDRLDMQAALLEAVAGASNRRTAQQAATMGRSLIGGEPSPAGLPPAPGGATASEEALGAYRTHTAPFAGALEELAMLAPEGEFQHAGAPMTRDEYVRLQGDLASARRGGMPYRDPNRGSSSGSSGERPVMTFGQAMEFIRPSFGEFDPITNRQTGFSIPPEGVAEMAGGMMRHGANPDSIAAIRDRYTGGGPPGGAGGDTSAGGDALPSGVSQAEVEEARTLIEQLELTEEAARDYGVPEAVLDVIYGTGAP